MKTKIFSVLFLNHIEKETKEWKKIKEMENLQQDPVWLLHVWEYEFVPGVDRVLQ